MKVILLFFTMFFLVPLCYDQPTKKPKNVNTSLDKARPQEVVAEPDSSRIIEAEIYVYQPIL